MSIRVLLDMNLSPEWVGVLAHEGWEAVHWSTVGDPRAPDLALMEWADTHQYIVITHDLDFTTVLALTQSKGPSVLLVRAQDLLPDRLGPLLIAALRQHARDLETGAIVVLDERSSRVRVLPLGR